MRIYALILIAGLFSAWGCKNNKEQAMNKIEVQFKNCLKNLNKTSENLKPIYMIIPRAGCSSCISNAESFMMSCVKDSATYTKWIHFILTDFDSEKTLRARFGNIYSNGMIIIDPENIFNSNKSLKSIYPTILFFNNESQLMKVSESSPSKDGIAEIKAFIATNS